MGVPLVVIAHLHAKLVVQDIICKEPHVYSVIQENTVPVEQILPVQYVKLGVLLAVEAHQIVKPACKDGVFKALHVHNVLQTSTATAELIFVTVLYYIWS